MVKWTGAVATIEALNEIVDAVVVVIQVVEVVNAIVVVVIADSLLKMEGPTRGSQIKQAQVIHFAIHDAQVTILRVEKSGVAPRRRLAVVVLSVSEGLVVLICGLD